MNTPKIHWIPTSVFGVLLLFGVLVLPFGKSWAQTVDIMPTGDSITHGFNSNSYRKYLELKLAQANCDYQMVGSRDDDLVASLYESTHAAYSGHTATHFATSNLSQGNPGIAALQSQNSPNVIMLHIGSNDINQGKTPQNTLEQITEILKQVSTSTTVLLANLIPWPANPTTDSGITSLRTLLTDAIQSGFTDTGGNTHVFTNVHLVDVNTDFTQATMMQDDGIHPLPSGDEFIADKYFDKFTELDLCNIALPPAPVFSAQLQNLSTNECVTITNSETSENADADSTLCISGDQSQILEFVPATTVENTYQLRFAHSNKCLSVENDATINGAAFQQRTCAHTPGQVFRWTEVATDVFASFVFTGIMNRALDSHSGSGDPSRTGDPIQWQYFGGLNQHWRYFDPNTTIDNTPPATTIDSNPLTIHPTPPQGAALLVKFTGTADDFPTGTGISNIRFAISNKDTENQTSQRCNATDDPVWYNFTNSCFGAYNEADLTPLITSPTTADWERQVLLEPGSYQIYALAVDINGLQDYSGAGVWPVNIEYSLSPADLIKPSGGFTFPTAGQTVSPSTSVDITGKSTDVDSGVERILIRIDRLGDNPTYWNGDDWQPASVWLNTPFDSSGNWTIPAVDLSQVNSYRMYINVRDKAGNIARTVDNPSPTFVVSNTTDYVKPDGTFTFPKNSQTVAPSSSIDITGAATDALSGVERILIRIERLGSSPAFWNGNNWQTGTVWLNTPFESSGKWTIANVDLSNSTNYRMHINVKDYAGNISRARDNPSPTFIVSNTTDQIKPSGTFAYPLDGAMITPDSSVDITGTATDEDSGVARILIRIDRLDPTPSYWNGTAWQSNSIWLNTPFGLNGSWVIPGVDLSALSNYRMYINVKDNAGNISRTFENPSPLYTVD